MQRTTRLPDGLDDESRAELLCYLVVGQLVAMARTGTWLTTAHLVESARIWLTSNGADCGWQERATLAQMSAELAPGFPTSANLRDEAELARLFTDGRRLDYRSTTVQRIHDDCIRYLHSC